MKNEYGVFYPQHDALGSVTMLTDQEGNLAERYSYSVTGEVTIYDSTGTELENSALGNRWMYTGRELLPELGLYDYRNRVYSAGLGRFLQNDPVKFHAKDLNLYRYVNNNYINLIDPEGLATFGIRINGSALWFFGVNISIAAVWDDKGGFDVMIGMGGAAAFSTPSASVTGGWTITNAESVKDLQGFSGSLGGTAAAGVAVEKSFVYGTNYVGTDFGAGIGGGLGVQTTAGYSISLLGAWKQATGSLLSPISNGTNHFPNPYVYQAPCGTCHD